MHEVGVEPDWVVGTSIGAINGAIIAGNHPDNRMERLHAFWDRMEINKGNPLAPWMEFFGNALANASTISRGIPGFFEPNHAAMFGQHAKLGVEKASYYSTSPLAETLDALIDFDYLQAKKTRLTVGAVNANTGAMRYFDSKTDHLTIDHVMASGALPPAFGAIRIDGEPYWDGGIYSNTPVEVVLDDNPRRDSTVFTVQLWSPDGPEPQSLWDINARLKDIQFSSRADSHMARQQQIHKLRHIIREMGKLMPPAVRDKAEMKELSAWGCGTTMHVVRMLAPRIEGEDGSKDIDFTARGIRTRWEAGYHDAQRAIAAAPWAEPTDPRDGLVIHNFES
jgi:NTE family protein